MIPLDKINALRNKHHVSPLQQCPELTKSSQQWADYLVHNGFFKHSGQQGKGENLAACGSPEQAVQMWYDEVDKYDWGNPRFTGATGHASQLLWKDSQQIGWGEARDDKRNWTIYVAQFTPAGNVMGGDAFARNVLRA